MKLQQPFDARQVDPSAGFPPPPVYADYHVVISDSEAKPTTKGDGGYLELTLQILDPGPYLNSKWPYRLNLYNTSQQTCEIAYRQLSAVCYVTGAFQIEDTRQLHNIPFIATIGPQKDNPQYSNVFNVKDINGNIPGKTPAASGATAVPPAPVAQPAAPAWAPPAAAAPAATAPAWAPPAAAAPAPAAPVWTPPGAPAPAAAPAPAWQPGGGTAAAPPWAK